MSAVGVNGAQGVLCAGALVLDTLVRPFCELHWGTTSFVEEIETRVGGSAANTARALGILGVPVRVAAVLGSDHPAEVIGEELVRYGVETSCIQHVVEPSAQTVVLIDAMGQRQFLHRTGCSAVAFRDGLKFTPALISGMSHFHLASLYVVPHLRIHAPAMLQEARINGMTTSLDTSWDPQSEWMKVLEPCLTHLDILFMNEDEAGEIARGASMQELAKTAIDKGTKIVVIKCGGAGCRIYTASHQLTCAAYEVQVRDTTGAGDCFVAGFLASYMTGASEESAGLMANATGALSVQQVGAVEGLLPRSEQEAWMNRTPFRRIGV